MVDSCLTLLLILTFEPNRHPVPVVSSERFEKRSHAVQRSAESHESAVPSTQPILEVP